MSYKVYVYEVGDKATVKVTFPVFSSKDFEAIDEIAVYMRLFHSPY